MWIKIVSRQGYENRVNEWIGSVARVQIMTHDGKWEKGWIYGNDGHKGKTVGA
jgi:hypothetical protein